LDRGAGLRFLTKAKSFPFLPFLPCCTTNPPSNPICNGVLDPAAKWPKRAAVNSLPSNCEVKNTKNITFILSVEGNKIAHGSGTFDAKFAVIKCTNIYPTADKV